MSSEVPLGSFRLTAFSERRFLARMHFLVMSYAIDVALGWAGIGAVLFWVVFLIYFVFQKGEGGYGWIALPLAGLCTLAFIVLGIAASID
jgi:hypothetical protein